MYIALKFSVGYFTGDCLWLGHCHHLLSAAFVY